MSKSSTFRYSLIILIAPALLAIVLALSMLFLKPDSAEASYGLENHIFLSPAVTPTTSLPVNSTIQPDGFISFINSPIFTNLLIVLGTIAASVIAVVGNHHLQQKRTARTAQLKEQQKAQTAQLKEQKRKEQENEAAKTFQEHIEEYRSRLKDDPSIAYLQILDTSRSLPVERIYVRLQLHQETRFKYTTNQNLPGNLLDAQSLHDPDILFRTRYQELEHRFSEALDPHQAIKDKDHKHFVILGDPGAGKTTLLKYLAIKSANKELDGLPDLPLYIQLNAFANSRDCNDLLEFVVSLWVKQYGFSKGEAQSYLIQELKLGNVLVLLDGLDETYIGETEVEAKKVYDRV